MAMLEDFNLYQRSTGDYSYELCAARDDFILTYQLEPGMPVAFNWATAFTPNPRYHAPTYATYPVEAMAQFAESTYGLNPIDAMLWALDFQTALEPFTTRALEAVSAPTYEKRQRRWLKATYALKMAQV